MADQQETPATTATAPLAHVASHNITTMTEKDRTTSPSPSPSIEKPTPPQPFNPGLRFYMAFIVLAVLTLMVALDGTTISVALPRIAQALHGTAIESFWAGTSFLLTSTVFQPSFASLSHIFGRKPLVLAAITLFLLGVLIAGFAKNFTVLLAGRSIQGIGGGGIIALTEILVTDLVPLRLRGQWMGVVSGMWAVGSVSGPVIGGAFAQTGWRWILWINLPFIGVSYVMIPLFLKINFTPSSMMAKLRRVDWVGTVLFIGSLTGFLLPISWGGVMYAWDSWHTLVPLLVGGAGLAAFVAYEKWVATEPMIRLSIFNTWAATLGYVTTVLHGMILWSLLFYGPLYFEAAKLYKPIIAGVAIFPASFTVAPMSVVTGILVTKTGKYRWAILTGWVLTTLGMGLNILLKPQTTIVQFIFIMLVGGVGMGMLFPAMQFAVQAAVQERDIAFGVSMFSFFRTFGQAVGVAVGGTVFQNQMHKKLLMYPQFASRAAELAKDAAGLVQVIRAMPEGSPDQTLLRDAYADSYRYINICLCAFAATGLVLSLFIKEYSMDRELETEQGFKHKKRENVVDAEEGQKVVDE